VRSTRDLVSDLADAFPRNAIRPGTVRIYVANLEDIPSKTLEAAVTELIKTSEFFPTVRAIREVAVERTLALPTEEEALSQVEARIGWRQLDELTRGEPPTVHADVKVALDHVGGFFAFRAAENPTVLRGQFLKIYRDLRAQRVRAGQVGGPLAIEAAA
jgi:hypothetical protein